VHHHHFAAAETIFAPIQFRPSATVGKRVSQGTVILSEAKDLLVNNGMTRKQILRRSAPQDDREV